MSLFCKRKARLQQQKDLRSQNPAPEALKLSDRASVRSLRECGFLLVCQLARREGGRLTFLHYLLVFIDRLRMNCNCVNLQGAESSGFRDHGEAGPPRDLCTSRLQPRPQSMLLQRGRTRANDTGKREKNDPQDRRRERDGMTDEDGNAGSRRRAIPVRPGALKPPSNQRRTAAVDHISR